MLVYIYKKKCVKFLQIQKWKRREKWLVTLRVNLQSKREKFGISSIATKVKQLHVEDRNLEEEEVVVDYLKFNKKLKKDEEEEVTKQ